MTRSCELKVLGTVMILIEAAFLFLLVGMYLAMVYTGAGEAKNWLDWAWVAIYTLCIPCVMEESGFLKAIRADLKDYLKNW